MDFECGFEFAHGGDIYSHSNNILDFSVNINPLGLSERVLKAGENALMLASCYPDTKCRELRAALAKVHNLNEDNIICGNGAGEIIFNIVFALKPKRVLILSPTFAEYERAARAIGAEIVYYSLREENNFTVENDILKIIRNVDMIFICNPNNPTGVCIENKLIEQILNNTGVYVLADECFMDVVEDNQNYSVLHLVEKYNKLFVLKAFTKLYAMPGIRLGYGLCSNKQLLADIYSVRQPWSVSLIAQKMGVEALNEVNLKKETVKYINTERAFLTDKLRELGIKYYSSEANYILLKSNNDLYSELLRHNILIRKCSNYKGLNDSYFRIAVKQHGDNVRLIKALEVIKWQSQ